MLFNSAIFIVLFAIVYLLYWQLSIKGKHYLIILASFAFYAWYSVPFLLLFLALLVINYYVSLILLERKSKLLLSAVILLDVGMLGFFKYFYLFAESIGSLIGNVYVSNLRENWLDQHDFQIILPIAISFYTFQVVAWVVDSYRGTINERVSPRRFFVFTLFFPQFVAGPIMRASDFMSQIDNPTPSRDRMLNGILMLLQGVVKKVLIADHIGSIVGPIYNNPSEYDAVFLILALPAFIAQIFCDFSGYTDMARGLAKLLGYEIPENFGGPMLANSVSEFWARWHITLSSWLRDYVYFPMGGSKRSEVRTAINLIVTMVVAGLWHGASWTFGIWGVYMGIFIVFERFLKRFNLMPEKRILGFLWTTFFFGISAVFFASPNIENTWLFIQGVFDFQRGLRVASPEALIALTIIGYALCYPQYYPRFKNWLGKQVGLRYALAIIGTFAVGLLVNLYGDVSGSFIYFAF